MTFAQTFKTSELPKSVKALVALTGRRPRNVRIEFLEGPTEVGGAWHTDAKSFGKVIGSTETNWTGSDGEPNTWVTEQWSAPVAKDTTNFGKAGYVFLGVSVKVVIGNLRELCPTRAVTATHLDLLMTQSVTGPAAEGTGVAVEICEPGPFNNLTESVVTKLSSLEPAAVETVENTHNAMLDQLGLM